MSMRMQSIITADVRTSEQLDRIVVTARQSSERRSLLTSLQQSLPGLKVRLAADGVWLPDQDADALLSANITVDLRWSTDARQFVLNRKRAKEVRDRIQQEIRDITAGGRSVASPYLVDASGLEVLDDHQFVNVAAMTLPGSYGLCLFDEQGTGKTVSVIYAYDVLVARDEVDFALILAPKSMVPEWKRDFDRFMNNLYRVEVINGTRHQKERTLQLQPDVAVTNFETAVSMENELRAVLRRYGGRAMLVVDESFFVKNLDAQRTRAIRRLREWSDRAYVLCGTPAPNSPQDLVQQSNIVDFGLAFAGVNIPTDRQAARPIVQQTLEQQTVFVRHLKSDVLPNLPSKRFHQVLLPFEQIQRQAYAAALDKLILDLRSTDESTFQRRLTSFLARRTALLQICSNPVSIVEGYSGVPAKLTALDSLLEEAIAGRGEKVVVWSFYTASLEAIVGRYGRFNPVRYDGQVSDINLRREAVRRFQEDNETMLFVGNPAAAGAGLTLHRAHISIYESLSGQAAHYLQSLDRTHRRGQTHGVEYLILLCEESIELEEYARLLRKEQAAQQLLGDNVGQQWVRETMLAEAVASLRRLTDVGQ
jgi:SNF2 family DNA or RNA helicase